MCDLTRKEQQEEVAVVMAELRVVEKIILI
jgi:hypothetical protein